MKKFDGTEFELEEDDALERINEELANDGILVERTETNDFSIKKNGAKAKTHFPLSINPLTKELTVTTPSGVKVVAVLPDQAVQNILQKRILNSIEEVSESASDTATASSSAQTTLTELNGEAVFKVKGFSNKKVVGLIPVSFAKTVFVSAEDGDIVKTDETFLSKILETVSF